MTKLTAERVGVLACHLVEILFNSKEAFHYLWAAITGLGFEAMAAMLGQSRATIPSGNSPPCDDGKSTTDDQLIDHRNRVADREREDEVTDGKDHRTDQKTWYVLFILDPSINAVIDGAIQGKSHLIVLPPGQKRTTFEHHLIIVCPLSDQFGICKGGEAEHQAI